jgi:hypothetical protein
MMYKNPQNKDPLRPEPSGIIQGWEVGAWIHRSDFVLNIVEPKFYGIVAHNITDPGSRIVAIRGTESAVEGSTMRPPAPYRFAKCLPRVASRKVSTRSTTPCK